MWCRYVDSNFATVDAELLTNSIMTCLSRTKGGITVAVKDELHGLFLTYYIRDNIVNCTTAVLSRALLILSRR